MCRIFQAIALLLAGSAFASLLFFQIIGSSPVAAQESRILEGHTIQVAELNDEKPQSGLPEVLMNIGKHRFHLEVAETPQQAATGLMYRTHLAPGHGMLFRFEPPRTVHFWMKNTWIPLDMVFIRNRQAIKVLSNVPPCKTDPCPTYSSDAPVDSVVELAAGTAAKHKIKPGSRVHLHHSSMAYQRTSIQVSATRFREAIR